MTGAGRLSERLATSVGSLLERRLSRRSALTRAAVAGSALAVAPVRYLVRPGTASALIGPGQCSPNALCNDGYTAFCCEIQHGLNACPANTFVAGWWKCTDYRGGGLCQQQGVRYYVDCNRTPGRGFAGGCSCAQGDCNKRRVDCNHFRYGQCNPQIHGTTEVVCRLVVCQSPATVPGFVCNGTLMVDDTTCAHEAGCLEGLAVPVRGGGGA
jgi:hypothetical protein